jgi:hypothetical protein
MADPRHTVVARGFVFDSSVASWIPDPKTAVGGGPGGGSTQVSIREILTSSGASVMDSTNAAIKVNVVAGSAAGSTVVSVSTGSVRVHQSTGADLNATVLQGTSPWVTSVSTGSLRIHQSTAADLQATVGPASTVWAVQLSNYSTIASISTGSVRVHQSSAADLQVTEIQSIASTTARASVTQSSTSVTLQSSNASRLFWSCYNRPTQGAELFVKLGTTASTTDYDVSIPAGGYYELPYRYTGRIDGIWNSTGAGFARVCEGLP